MAYEIEIKELPARHILTMRTTTTPDKIGETYGQLLPRVADRARSLGVEPTGPPFGIYHAYGDDRVDLEVGVPVPGPIEGAADLTCRELPAGRAAVTWHVGPYDGLAAAYRALERSLQERRLDASGPPWEVYWTDPQEEPDSAKWRTEVGYPIR